METINEFFNMILAKNVRKIVLSGRRDNSEYRKATFTLIKDEYFVERLTNKQAFHSHVDRQQADSELIAAFEGFSQVNAWDDFFEYTAKISKKSKILTGRHPIKTAPKQTQTQNRKKKYLIEEGTVVPPLVDMGVMTPAGEVKKAMNDKFRQINRFLELIDDVIRESNAEKLNIVDFGCGKSYLTFIVYYYFSEIRHIKVNMTGIDLKEDVIEFCNALVEKYKYENLSFIMGDIADFDSNKAVDMVISLHACDTATDYALFNAIKCNAKYILSVPCCQHELAKSIDLTAMPIFDDDGILRERVASLMTDGIRAKLLTACSYKTQLLEFVDLCHTPKNILIRAKRTNVPAALRRTALEQVESTLSGTKTSQKLYDLLYMEGTISSVKGEGLNE